MISIIIVNYNGAKDTLDCLKSLNMISNSEMEIIIVDNKSTDDSLKILKESQKKYEFTLLKALDNKGFSAGNNIGIKYAMSKGTDYFVLLNNDTVVKPDFLDKLMKGFKVSNDCGITTSRILYYENPNKVWYAGGALNMVTSRTEHFYYKCIDAITDTTPKKVSFASGCCMCISRNVIEKIGLLDEDFFLYEEDTEYCHRIHDYGFSIWYIPDSIIYHKVSASTGVASSVSQYYCIRNKYMMINKSYSGICKFISYVYSTLQMLNRCRKGELDYRYFIMGVKAFKRGEKGRAKVILV